ncbi:MAG: TatD family hydrolase [Gammaproteobacteria bacterium]|nr:TatD family hydrolase [Gammaproteobacteria bacterium]
MLEGLIDTHCHLDFPIFDSDRFEIMCACQDHDIQTIIIPSVCRKDWQKILSLSKQHPMLYPALGLHPCFTDQHHKNDLQQLNQMCANTPSLIAIGEIGLDYWHKNSDKKIQNEYFSEQLDIACHAHLPVLIHARKSHHDVLNALRARPSLNGGIIHAYSGSYEQAKEYLKLGFKLGFGGAFTYPKATRLRALISRLPIEAWVLETDAPDMTPIKHYGEKNSPQYLNEIAHEFTMLYDNTLDDKIIITQLNYNTCEVFPFL